MAMIVRDTLLDIREESIYGRLAAATKQEPHVDHPALQVAAGGYELAVFLIAGPWDLAAPALIVEEAGGRFTDLTGRHDLTSGTAVFSNALLHEDVLKLISHVVGEPRSESRRPSYRLQPTTPGESVRRRR